MPRYQTEVHIPPDRYVCLQLPERMPEGRAIVTVVVQETEPQAHVFPPELELDRQDIEWWEEFEGEPESVD